MKIALVLIIIMLSGCVLYRHDKEPDRDSVTFYTLFKDFDISIDPNSVEYESSSNKMKIVTPPYFYGETR